MFSNINDDQCYNNSSTNRKYQLYRFSMVYKCRNKDSHSNGSNRRNVFFHCGFNNRWEYRNHHPKYKYSGKLRSYLHHRCLRGMFCGVFNYKYYNNDSTNGKYKLHGLPMVYDRHTEDRQTNINARHDYHNKRQTDRARGR